MVHHRFKAAIGFIAKYSTKYHNNCHSLECKLSIANDKLGNFHELAAD